MGIWDLTPFEIGIWGFQDPLMHPYNMPFHEIEGSRQETQTISFVERLTMSMHVKL